MGKPFVGAIAGLFAQVLGRELASPTDNFFAVGGDSLAAVEVLEHVEELFGVALRIRDFQEAPTPERLALAILRERARLGAGDLADQIAGLTADDAARMLALLQAKR